MIVAAGLTPAWQQIMQFERLRLGEVNRARRVLWCASGKVLNVGIALRHLGAESQTVTLLGGTARGAIEAEFAQFGAPLVAAHTECPTRICTTLLDRLPNATATSETTELVENAAAIRDEELQAFYTVYRHAIAQADAVVLTGSIPPGVPKGVFADMLGALPQGCRSVLDIRGPEFVAALAMRPMLVKPNRDELGATVGRALHSDDETFSAMREICAAGAQWILVTSGPRPALLAGREHAFRLQGPTVAVVNPIAAGDCAAAGIAMRLAEGNGGMQHVIDAVRWGMAAAANNVEMLLPARLAQRRVQEIVAKVSVETVD
jgi:1-phosphofructokinase family hexose kinase